MTKNKEKPIYLEDAITFLHNPRFATFLHFCLLIIAVVVAFVLLPVYNYRATALTVVDSSRTLIAFNGTLLALVVGFSAFYFTVIDTRRIEATHSHDPETWVDEIKGMTTALYRKKMRDVSTFLVSIAITYSFFIGVSYIVYLFSLPMASTANITSLIPLIGFTFSTVSPIVTIGDAIIMTWFLTKDVAGQKI